VIIFCRPTDTNVALIKKELANPHFSQYNLYFSNKLSQPQMVALAEADSNNVVNQLQEVYLDFNAINPQLYSLNIPGSIA